MFDYHLSSKYSNCCSSTCVQRSSTVLEKMRYIMIIGVALVIESYTGLSY